MLGPILALICFGVLYAVLSRADAPRKNPRFGLLVMIGYVLRLVIQFFVRDVQFFSHGFGGDCLGYEELGRLIAVLWQRSGMHFVTAAEFEDIGPTSLPPNLFALVMYANDGQTTRLGCTALVALAAALTVINLYSLSVEFGAKPTTATFIAAIIYFEPAFLFYSSDLYKDALVICFTIGALASAVRLAFRFSVLHIAIGLVCVWALWYVRFYLIFVTLASLLVGVLGVGSKSIVRPLLAGILFAAATIALANFTDVLELASERANQTFELATSERAIEGNSHGGSGVLFEDSGDPYQALPAKLAYTLFSPFPWTLGSIGFHIGKLDAFLWYFLLYRAIRGSFNAPRRLVMMLATFIVPTTFMYALTMSNVGLIVRQRLVIVAATAVLAAMYTPKKKAPVRAQKTASTKATDRPIRAAA